MGVTAVSLLSGGIDSAVSSHIVMNQTDIVLVHFANQTATTGAENKVIELAKVLAKTKKTKLYLVPFRELQFAIIKNVPSAYRMIVYKRFMLKIAAALAKRLNARALVTGDSLGQVASQTLDNIKAIYESTQLPIITPLLGKDKEEIIKVAKAIGTFQLSALPYEDCCTFMVAKHPETHAKLDAIKKYEAGLDEQLITHALDQAVILEF